MISRYLEPDRPVSLYIHIPFCTTKCGYCAFYSLPQNACRDDDMSRFLDVLSRQLEALVEDLGRPFHTVYIGGGNPGLIGASRIDSLLTTAFRYGRPVECSMEINPETLDESFSLLLGKVDRFSVGIQSFDGRHLRALGRNADTAACTKALDLLTDFRNEAGTLFNADLMTNIPRQSLDDALGDIDTLVSWQPDHISLYSLTFEEGTRLIEQEVPAGEDEEADMLNALWSHLDGLGYEQYEVSAFARDGHYCAHNLVYWNLGQYIGLGPGAESSVGYSSIVSSRESESLDGYLSDPSFSSVRLSREEAVEEYLMTCLRTRWGLDKEEFSRRFSSSFDDLFSSAVSTLEPEWYNDGPDRFRLTRDGIMVLNRILLALFLDL